jgi:hypothetical protein
MDEFYLKIVDDPTWTKVVIASDGAKRINIFQMRQSSMSLCCICHKKFVDVYYTLHNFHEGKKIAITAMLCSRKCSRQARKKLIGPQLCMYCFKPGATMHCARCKTDKYCSRECQVADWPVHKKICKQM